MSLSTVAAVSTPMGEGGIGVIRISGDEALPIADKCFRAFSGEKLSALEGYRAAYGELVDGDEVIDDAVALVFRAPKSYTGEDVVEFSVHGGTAMVRRALRTVLSCGAKAAEGGELTKRAFLNGKLDLAKAESIMGLISARGDAALRISRSARSGRISREVEAITSRLLETAAALSVQADYPDEDIPELSDTRLTSLLDESRMALNRLLSTYDAGKVLREGVDCVIVGKPNVGKSTLMNLLCGSDRSIVTDIAGTTRDIIENTVVLGDITLNLADTAGIHDTDDTVESVGVDRAVERLDSAALVLAVFDASAPLDDDDRALLEKLQNKTAVAVLNKCDLGAVVAPDNLSPLCAVSISAKNSDGVSELTKAVAEVTKTAQLSPDDAVLISERQRDCAARALDAVTEAQNALSLSLTLDAVGVCIDDALSALLELTGKRVTNEVTDEVFRKFCVGK